MQVEFGPELLNGRGEFEAKNDSSGEKTWRCSTRNH
jgi:hypothetical protein